MTDFRERIFRSRDENTLKRLASRIPGYGGYLEKEMRRDADKMLRDYIAAQLERQRKHLTEAQAELLGMPGGLELMGEIERVQKKLQLLVDRLRTAVYGYAGWFDAVTVRENELDALYTYDTTLLLTVDQIAEGVQKFVAVVEDEGQVRPTIRALRVILDAMHEQVDRRRDVLTGALSPDLPNEEVAAPEEVPPAPEEETTTTL